MTSTPQEPLEEPLDTGANDEATGGRAAGTAAPVSGSPAEADSDVGYSRGAEGESAEQAGAPADDTRTDYLDTDGLAGGSGDPGPNT